MEEINDLMSEDEKNLIFEENKKITEENSKKLQFYNISFRLNEFLTLSELFDCYSFLKGGKYKTPVGLSLADNGVENEQAMIIDIGLALKCNLIILNGINNRQERMCKINRFIDLIEELY
jgi:enolase